MSTFTKDDKIPDFLSGGQALQFVPPPEFDKASINEAHQPAELRGLRRDQVRLMVLPRCDGPLVHTHFNALGEFLRPGDLLVLNNSRTLPALLRARDELGDPLEVRLARRRSSNEWDVLLLDGRVCSSISGRI